MSDSILFLSSGSICYDSTEYFIECISRELMRRDWSVLHVRLDKSTQEDGLRALVEQYANRPFDYVFDINTKLCTVRCDNGDYCFDRLARQTWHYILDHPFYHHNSLKTPLDCMNVICLDRKHAELIRRTYPHIKKCVAIPVAAEAAGGATAGMSAKSVGETVTEMSTRPVTEIASGMSAKSVTEWAGKLSASVPKGSEKKSLAERARSLIFTSSYTDPDMVYLHAMKQDEENVSFFKAFTQILLDNPRLTQEEAVEMICGNMQGTDVMELLQKNYLADVYLQAVVRQEIVVWLIRKRVPLALYGHNWDIFLSKAKILMKDDADFIDKCVEYMGEVSYVELPGIYGDARISINQLPWFKDGMHDRTPLALMNGCLCVSDPSVYMQETIPKNSGVVYYSLEDIEGVAAMLQRMTREIEDGGAGMMKWQQEAQRGTDYAEKNMSWKAWVDAFEAAVR